MIASLHDSDLALYHTLETGAVWFPRPLRWTSIRGAKATDALNGLITNDVGTLGVGHAHAAAALAPKGKMLCDMIVVRESDEALLVGVAPLANDGWLAMLRKYVNPRLAKVADESERYHASIVVGPTAERVAKASEALATPFPLAMRSPAFLVLADATAPAGTASELSAALGAAGGTQGSELLWSIARVEAGIPEWGVDMDENTIPQEANLDSLGAISFTKGCYTGQETVARIHFRGHVNRHLRGVLAREPIAAGDSITDSSGKVVGEVRSAVVSPRLGAIGLAMLRREIELGGAVTIGSQQAVVASLPF